MWEFICDLKIESSSTSDEHRHLNQTLSQGIHALDFCLERTSNQTSLTFLLILCILVCTETCKASRARLRYYY